MSVPIISFIGWSGVGKTTFLEKLISCLKKRGLRIALIKHDGHDFQMDTPGKDTWRFTQAGADVVAISNDRHGALLENRPISFAALLEKIRDVDLILTEGYDDERLPQVEIHRKGFPRLRAREPEKLLAVVSDEPIELAVPVFSFEDTEALSQLLFPMDPRETACRLAVESLPPEAAEHADVSVSVNGETLPLLPFVQDIFRQVNQGLLSTLRNAPEAGEVCIRIRRDDQRMIPAPRQ